MNLPQKMMSRNKRFLFMRIMIMIRIMRRYTWSLFQIQSLLEKPTGRCQDSFVILRRMQRDIQLLKGLSERARGLKDIQGIRP